ncbi:MAG: U32 family peptidase [Ruminococcaceae bacterium]|nr:U32 family peptidase [Oscillospiraceae bacterium]
MAEIIKGELLAPAGDIECVNTALHYGADAVYVGGRLLQLRAAASGFTDDNLFEAVSKVHEKNKKIYVTVNCFAKDSEFELLPEYARFLNESGVDAVIVSDLGVLSSIKRHCPDLQVHISTQANCMNSETANVYYNMGATRVVLARELTLEDIKTLRAKTPKELELEAFVHGAMCMAHSGRCLISSYLTNRSANRGACSQPCRWSYYLVEKTRPGVYIPIEQDGEATQILSSHDLNCVSILKEIEEAGVCSFKIEGRMKTAYYVASVINAYRRVMDGVMSVKEAEEELTLMTHRPYSTGFYYGAVKKEPFNDGLYHHSGMFIATVKEKTSDGVYVQMRNRFAVGDTLELMSREKGIVPFNVERIEGEEGDKNEAVFPMEIIKINCPECASAGDMIRKRVKGC